MDFHWCLPHPGAIKVNVHGVTPFIPFQNGNTNGIGMIMRNSEGELIKLSTGIIPGLSPLKNQLKVIHHGLIKAFEDNYKEIILETDNLDVFRVLKSFPHNVPAEVAEVAGQIMIRLNDPRWICSIVFVYPDRNKLATYLARIGGERCKNLFTFTRPVGATQELMSLDLGFGNLDPMSHDVIIQDDEEDPVDFGPNYLVEDGIIHGGYAFKEDLFVVHDVAMDTIKVMPIHEAVAEDSILGHFKENISMDDYLSPGTHYH